MLWFVFGRRFGALLPRGATLPWVQPDDNKTESTLVDATMGPADDTKSESIPVYPQMDAKTNHIPPDPVFRAEDGNDSDKQGVQSPRGNFCHKCPHCPDVFTRLSSVKRHISRKHKAERENNEQTGGHCLCLYCGFKCRRICDLHKHLSKQQKCDIAKRDGNIREPIR